MSAIILRIIILAIILAVIGFGLRRIWRDWTAAFRAEDKQRRQRDLKERQRPDVITLKRSEDGVYRSGEDDERR